MNARRDTGAALSPWHVSPAVDVLAYAFSWAPILVAFELATTQGAWVALFLLVIGLTFAHRHYTLPYVYLDREIFARHPRRFVVFPLLMLLGFAAAPWLWSTRARIVVAAVVFFAGAWNVWHVYRQKFGILRLYAAKSDDPGGSRSPRWADLFLVLCWPPLYVVWLGPSYRELVARSFPTVADIALPAIDVLTHLKPWLLPPAVGLVVGAIATFVFYEWRARRFRSAPRLVMALGTTALSSAFLFFDPVRVFLAFAFSHAVEYMVFVWAYQRRRYRDPMPHDPLLGRLLRRPALAYSVFTVGITAPYLLARFWGYSIMPDAEPPVLLGTTWERWAFYWSVFQSMVHFYYDGFLWKMRLPAVRASL